MENKTIGRAALIIARALVDLLEGDERKIKRVVQTVLQLHKFKIH